MSTNSSVCPVCGKARASSYTFNLSPNYYSLGNTQATATITSMSTGGIVPNTMTTLPWSVSYPSGHSGEMLFTPSASLTDLCYGAGECASKACSVCTWMIRPGDDHDCAKLANSVGKSGTISHHALEDKFIALLTQLRKDAELLAGDYTLSLDEEGQPNAPWLAEVIQALKCATDEAAHVILD